MPVPFRVYMDTDVLISAILESDPEWQRDHKVEAKRRSQVIQASNMIFTADYMQRWKPKTSVYSISEFISTGRRRFGKTFTEMYELISKEVFPRCEVINAELHQQGQGLPKIDSQWEKHWIFSDIHCKGDMVDRRSNKPLEMRDLKFISSLTSTGVYHSKMGGVVSGTSYPDLNKVRIAKLKSIKCSAPAFEILLLIKASEIANEYNLHLSDALHILYAQGNAGIILTNDEKFHKQWDKNPKFQQKSGLQVKSTVDFVQWCQSRGWI